MRKLVATTLFVALLTSALTAQKAPFLVFTDDLDRFWMAYDSCRLTTDSLQQLQYIQQQYIDPGSPGLKAFMQARDYTAAHWVHLIRHYPKFWDSVRPNTLAVKQRSRDIEQRLRRLRKLYPALRPARMYFTIGGLRSGGTVMDDMVLIGTEIAAGDASTVVSEFTDAWLASVFRCQQPENIVALNIHEYVHTQQTGPARDLLGQAILEGSCDFITELVLGQPLQHHYLEYGRQHESELKARFMAEMFTPAYRNWLYNGSQARPVADLGYFMGYAICRAYYAQAKNKRRAIREIIELNYSDTAAVETFLKKSRYYPVPFDKQQLIRAYTARQPYVLCQEPFANGDTLVDAATREMKIVFSAPLHTGSYSFEYGPRGVASSPVAGMGGFSDDGTTFTLRLKLEPGREYEFIVSGDSFRTAEGYPLLAYTVGFRTQK